MYQIDNSTAVAARPAASAAGTAGWFTDGSPGSGVPATILPAEFMNMLQAEFLTILSTAGITPSKTTSTQLMQALIQQGLQDNQFNSASATGTADALIGAFSPTIAALPSVGVLTVYVRAAFANATTTPTFTPNSGVIAAKSIVKGAGAALAAGDIAGAGHWIELQYDLTLDKWVLLNPATGVSSAPSNQIQAITSSVASNALTVGYAGATTVQFRNPTLANGAPVSANIASALSLVVPSGATLGTTSAVQAQLALVLLYNAGAPALGIVNMAGGVNLDETTLLSTTAISAAATSAGVVYSTAAITSSPFRVLGVVTITEAVAGTWATGQTVAQGVGGLAQIAQMIGNSAAFTASKGSTGYQKLPSGIIIQWGSVGSVASGSGATATFPVAFPNSFLSAVASFVNTGGISGSAAGGWGIQTASNMTVFNNGSAGASSISWIAIGY